MSNVCPTGLFFETQPIEEGLFKPVSSLQTHKHPSVCLQRKGDQSWICMRMRSPGRRRPCPSKAAVAGRPGGLCSSTCSPRGLTGRAPSSWLTGPTARGSLLACPAALAWQSTAHPSPAPRPSLSHRSASRRPGPRSRRGNAKPGGSGGAALAGRKSRD